MNGQMNMNYGNQYPNQGMMPNMQQPMYNQYNQQQSFQQAPVQEKDPKALKKAQKRKGLIIKLIVFIIVFFVMFFGKKYIDFITLDYKPIVDEALSEFYYSGDSQKLKPIQKLLADYKKNTSIVKKIQSYSYEQVGKWFYYIDDKYICDKNNANSCVAQLNEFRKLVSKVGIFASAKGGGYFIITPKAYTQLKTEGERKITNLQSAVNNKTYSSPKNSETIYQEKCLVATECDCRDGICSCKYTSKNSDGSKKIEDIKCYKPNQTS